MTTPSNRRSRWLLATGGLLLLLLAVLWTYKADDYLRDKLILAVQHESDYRLQIDGAFSVSLFSSKTVEAADIRLYPKQQPDPLLQIGKLETQLSLLSLISGKPRIKRLMGEQVLFDPDAAPRAGDDAPFDPADVAWLPVIEKLELHDIRLDRQDPDQEAPWEILLSEVNFDLAADGGSYQVEGKAGIAGQEYALTGRIGSLSLLLSAQEAYPLHLEIASPLLKLTADGAIARPLSGEGLELSLASEASELASALAVLDPELPALGRLTVNARLQGDFENSALQDIEARLELPGKLHLEAHGTLQGLTTKRSGDLQVKGYIKNREVSAWLLPSDMASIDDWELQGRLTLEGDQLGFRDFKAQGVDKAGLRLETQGKGMFGDPQQPHPFAGLELRLAFDADNTRAGQSLIIEDLPEIGPARGSARLLAPAGDRFAIEDYQVKVGRENELQIGYDGRIGHIPMATDLPAEEIDLQVNLTAARTEQLAHVWGTALPEIGPVRYSGHFVGSEADGLFKELSLTAGTESGLKINARGQLRLGDSRVSEPPKSIDVAVDFATPKSASITTLTDSGLPELGPVKGRFQVTGRLQGLKLSGIEVTAGRADTLALSAEGTVEKLAVTPALGFSGVNLKLNVASPASKKVFPLFGLGAIDLGTLRGNALLVDADGSLGLEKAALRFSRPELLDIRVSGQIDKLEAWDQIDTRLALTAANTKAIGAIFDQDWRNNGATVKANGALRLENDKLSYSGSLDFGKTEIAIEAAGGLEGGKPRLEGTIASEVLYLTDFGFPETAEEMEQQRRAVAAEVQQELNTSQSQENKKGAEKRIFGTDPLPWDALHTLNLKLALQLNQVEGTGSSLEALAAEITLKDGRLLMTPAVLDYDEGTLLLDLLLDANDKRAAFKLSADDVAIGKAWSHVQAFVPVSGNVNVHIDLSSSGASPADLAANLNGVMGMASENLEVPYYTADLLAVNILGWVVKKAVSSDATVLVHCSIIQSKMEKGRAEISRLFFDGPNMTVTGEGWIDLGTETLDVSIFPERKSGFWSKAEPVRLSGALADPEIDVTVVDKKTAAAAGAAAGVAAGAVAVPVLVLPAVAIGALLEMITGDEDKGESSPCLPYLVPAK